MTQNPDLVRGALEPVMTLVGGKIVYQAAH